MGSDSDLIIMKEASIILEDFDIAHEITILSAHRTADLLADYIKEANNTFEVIIAGAGAAAHLPGVIASHTTLPVIGVPINSSVLNGIDSLYAIVQMPSGIPVSTMAIGKAGAINSAIYAAQILGIKHKDIRNRIVEYRKKLSSSVIKKSEELKSIGWRKYLAKKS